jgi:NAD-dependent dihydropyrimidine dehydrogenase PreA subunit
VIGKDLISIGCTENLVEKRKIEIPKKNLYEEATVIIPLVCEDGLEEIAEIFEDKKVICIAKTLGVGDFTPSGEVVLTTPFEDTGLESKSQGYSLNEVAEKLNLHKGFFDEDVDKDIQEFVTLTINGEQIKARKNQNLVAVCEENNIDLPHLCCHDDLDKYGSCRMCLVKIDGFRDLPAACCTEVAEGMNIVTSDEELEHCRKVILELAISSGAHNCLTCTKGVPTPFAACELQALARRYGITESRFEQATSRKPEDDSSPVIYHDPNKCILCGRCVRACEEIAGLCNLGFVNRGQKTTVVAGLNKDIDQSACVTCMACTNVCPTGALIEKVVHFSGENWESARVLGA